MNSSHASSENWIAFKPCETFQQVSYADRFLVYDAEIVYNGGKDTFKKSLSTVMKVPLNQHFTESGEIKKS